MKSSNLVIFRSFVTLTDDFWSLVNEIQKIKTQVLPKSYSKSCKAKKTANQISSFISLQRKPTFTTYSKFDESFHRIYQYQNINKAEINAFFSIGFHFVKSFAYARAAQPIQHSYLRRESSDSHFSLSQRQSSMLDDLNQDEKVGFKKLERSINIVVQNILCTTKFS